MKIGFIGLGNMASAMIGGILKKNCILQRTSSALTNQRIPFKSGKNIWNTYYNG